MVLRGVDPDRLDDRRSLLSSFDRLRRDIDSARSYEAVDTIQQRAIDILTSSRLAQAFDLSREDPRTLERYGKGDPKKHADGAPLNLQHFLLARRLVEAGCRVAPYLLLGLGVTDARSRHHLDRFLFAARDASALVGGGEAALRAERGAAQQPHGGTCQRERARSGAMESGARTLPR